MMGRGEDIHALTAAGVHEKFGGGSLRGHRFEGKEKVFVGPRVEEGVPNGPKIVGVRVR